MEKKNFADNLIKAILEKKSYLCVGLDPQLRYIPPHILKACVDRYGPGLEATAEAILIFNKGTIDATMENALCYKLQSAFYEAYGHHGIKALERTIAYLKSFGLLVIDDAKREDGESSAEAYAEGYLGIIDVISANGELRGERSVYDVDAITITPWTGEANIIPFANVALREGKGVFVVDKTSFKQPSFLQEEVGSFGNRAWINLGVQVEMLGQKLIGKNGYSSLGIVMGATNPKDVELVRDIFPNLIKLVPGFGAQGTGPNQAVACISNDGLGIIVNSSRAINYAWHPKFKTGLECAPENFQSAVRRASEVAKDVLNEAVVRRIGRLPW